MRLIILLILLASCSSQKNMRHPSQEDQAPEVPSSESTASQSPCSNDQKPWNAIQSSRFGIMTSLDRNQGITSDGAGTFWFSGKKNLQRTKEDFSVIENNSSPITDDMKKLGLNHLGGIDYADGKIYAPIEDGKKYQNPYISVYDAKTLHLLKAYPLPVQWLPDGIPWIALAGKNQILSSQYSQATKINVYDAETFAPVRQIDMSMTVDSIQGGKVVGNYLYLTADDAEKDKYAVYAMNLDSGKVIKTLSLADNVSEVEGLSMSENADKCDLYVLTVTGSGLSSRAEVFHYQK